MTHLGSHINYQCSEGPMLHSDATTHQRGLCVQFSGWYRKTDSTFSEYHLVNIPLLSLKEKGKLLFSRVEPQFSGSHSNSKHTYHGARFALMKNWKSFHMISLSVWENVAKVVVVVGFNSSFYLTVSENKLFVSNLCTGNYMYKCFQCKNCWIDLY